MFKRITAALLAVCIAVSLAACGGKDGSETVPRSEKTTADDGLIQNSPSDSGSQSDTADGERDEHGSTAQTSNTTTATAPQTVKVTVVEGMTLLKLSWLLEDKGICSSKAFVKAAENYPMSSYSILSSASSAPNVCFRLEGYLFPATYEFPKNSDPKTVIDKMVATAQSRLAGISARASELGYSVHQILSMASIIEKESKTSDQRSMVSAVLHNRLKKGMKLQCDVTIKYCEGVIKVQYGQATMDKYKYYYNTERCSGLPAGPICNPGMASINAALYPAKNNNLYFIITDKGALYAETYEQHQANGKQLGLGNI